MRWQLKPTIRLSPNMTISNHESHNGRFNISKAIKWNRGSWFQEKPNFSSKLYNQWGNCHFPRELFDHFPRNEK